MNFFWLFDWWSALRSLREQVRVVRLERRSGLIQAKQAGGDAAVGDIVVFFDCHVAPQKDWCARAKRCTPVE